MTIRTTSALVLSAVLLCISSVPAQQAPQTQPAPRRSPHDLASGVVDGNRVMIIYARPFSKDPANEQQMRKIWGTLVPYGQVWRLGANEATLMVTQQPIVIGGATVPAGAYSLYMLPSETGQTKLIVNKQIGQSGDQYDEKQDLARVDMTRSSLNPRIDQLTIVVAPVTSGAGEIKVQWENTQFSVPFTVKK